MTEFNDFAKWDEQFDPVHHLNVSEGLLDLAKTLVPDILSAPVTRRKELSEEATKLLEETYPMDFISRELAVVAGRALVIERLLWDEFVVKGTEIDGPVFTAGTVAGFRFIHHKSALSGEPVPVFGLKLTDSKIMSVDEVPVATISYPLLIPVDEIRESPTL